ncbi:YmfQ family protein [Heyndrickxia oleronia]|uniref:putative phage tail protein n=1 Tax=Heyndrickxia oleronia TaxID=38875 RepID=UPI0020400AF8|nr:putative phage tail protein [Heyndrickxia oleronia]MCM3239041.1 YmfQ family protein [Heyndrickxia oleronia]
MNKFERMNSYVSHKHYGKSPQMQGIFKVESSEFEELENAMQEVLDQFFIDTATWGLIRWEEPAGLKPKANTPLDIRRANIKAKYVIPETVTDLDLQELVNMFVPSKQAKVVEIPNEYAFEIQFPVNESVYKHLPSISEAVEETKPAHLEALYRVFNQVQSTITFGGLISERKRITIKPIEFKMSNLNLDISRAGFISTRTRTTIKPEVIH